MYISDKNVIRQDVVQIGFLIDDEDFLELQRTLDVLESDCSNIVSEIEQDFEELDIPVDAIEDFKDELDGLDSSSVIGDLTSEVDTLKDEFKGVGSYIKGLPSTLKQLTVDKLTNGIDKAKNLFRDTVSTVKNLPSTLKQLTVDKVNSGVSKLHSGFAKIKNLKLSDITTGMKNGVSKAVPQVELLGKKLNQVANVTFDKVTKGIKRIASSASDTGKKVGKAAVKGIAVGLTAASVAVTGLGAASIATGKNFESGMSQVAATMGVVADSADYKVLEKSAKDMGASTAFTSAEAAEALNYLALAGYNAEKAATALPTVLHLAGAGGMELATASDMITDSMAALKLDATQENLSKFADSMAVTAQKSNTSVQELGEGILTIGSTASNLKGGTTELNAALGILADVGLKGADGGTHLRNIILSLQNPTTEAAKTMKQLGVNVYDAQGKMRGVNEIMKDLDKSMIGMSDKKKDSIMSTLFNRTDVAAAGALVTNAGARFDELTGYIDNSAGACEKMYGTMLDNLDGDIAILQSSVEALGIEMYEKLKKPLRSVSKLATNTIGKLSDAFKEGGFHGISDAIGGVLADIIVKGSEFAPKIISMGVSLIEHLVDGIGSNEDAIVDGLFNVISAAVKGIGRLIPKLITVGGNIVRGIGEKIVENKDAIISYVSALAAEIVRALYEGITGKQIGEDTFDSLKTSLQGILEAAKQVVGFIVNNFGSIATVIGTITAAVVAWKVATTAINTILTIQNGLVAVYNAQMAISKGMTIAEAVAQWGLNAALLACPITWIVLAIIALIAVIVLLVKNWDKVKEVVTIVWNKIKGIWGSAVAWFSGIVTGIKNKFVTVFTGIKNFVKNNFVTIASFIINPFAGIFALLYKHCEGFRKKVDIVVNAIKTFFISAFNTLKAPVMAIVNFIVTLITTVTTIIITIIQGIVMTIVRCIQRLFNIYKAIFKAIWNVVVFIFTSIFNFISSVVSSIWNVVVSVFTTIFNTISSVLSSIWSVVSSIWNSIITFISGVLTSILNKVSEVWESVKNAITEKMIGVYNSIKGKFDEIKNLVGGIKDDMLKKGKDIIQGLIDGITSKFTELDKKVKELGDKITGGIKKFFDINSPSKVMQELGGWTFEGFNIGLDNELDEVDKTTGELNTTVTEPFSENRQSLFGSKYTPEGDASTSSSARTVTNNYDPQFNLTIHCSDMSERELERKTKQWFKESIKEMWDSLDRRNPEPQEV